MSDVKDQVSQIQQTYAVDSKPMTSDLCPICGAYWECDCIEQLYFKEKAALALAQDVELSPEDIEFWLELNAAAISEKEQC